MRKKKIISAENFFLLLCFLFAGRLVANALLPVFDPSEARYANVCANMARTGNYLEPQFVHNGVMQIFEGKPPLYFQMGAISCKLFGVNEFAVRFPATLSAVAILLMVCYTVKKFKGRQAAGLSTLLCAFTPVFFIFSGLCLTDLLLTAAICGAVCFYMLFAAETQKFRKKTYSVLFFASLGVGMLVKGPVALVMAGMPIFLYLLCSRRWAELKEHTWIAGLLVFLLIAAPWYVLMQSKNPDFLEYFFVNENFKRFLFKEYGDRYGVGRESFRGMALVYMLLCNLPFLLGALLALLPRNRKKIKFGAFRSYLGDPLTGLAFFWLVSNTLFWCLTSRVLITYLLPTIPATAMLLPGVFDCCEEFSSEANRRRWNCILGWFCVICAAGLLIAPFVMPAMKNNAGHFFASIKNMEKYREYPVYFVKNTPYAAEFYLGDRVRNHPKELRDVALLQSEDCLLLAVEHDLKRITIDREVLARFGPWILYAPVQKTPAELEIKEP